MTEGGNPPFTQSAGNYESFTNIGCALVLARVSSLFYVVKLRQKSINNYKNKDL